MRKRLLVLVFVFSVILVGVVVALNANKEQEPVDRSQNTQTDNTPKSGKIDEHLTINETLRDVNFCGITYRTKQILIDGVDITQRIAYLATNKLIPSTFEFGYKETEEEKQINKNITEKDAVSKSICENVRLNAKGGEVLDASVGNKYAGTDIGLDNQTIYSVYIEQSFSVALPSGQLFVIDGFGGLPIGPIGELQ